MHSSYVPSAELLEEFLGAFPSNGHAPPTLDELRLLVGVTFWASLRTEEGQPIRPALSFIPREAAAEAAQFAEFVPLSIENLAKLSPALRHGDVHVGVFRHQGGLWLWGLVLLPVDGALRIRATSPGVLHLSAGLKLVATLSGERAQLVATSHALQFNELLTRALGVTSDLWLRSHQNDYLRHIARRIREHGRGGTLVIVPSAAGGWTESLRIRHRFVSPLEDIVNAWRDETEAHRRQMVLPAQASRESLEEGVNASAAARDARGRALALSDRIGDLTAIDGAVVATHELALVGFGAKMATDLSPPQILEIRPVVGATFERTSLEALGGMRHQSAARFVTAQPDCVALVVSQDGMVSLFSWFEEQRAVIVARELELLLWSG